MSQSSDKDLIAWQKGMELGTMIYDAPEGFPWLGLASQLPPAAGSVPGNIAEGKADYSNRDFVRLLRPARGSVAEIETQAMIAQQGKYPSPENTTRWTHKLDEPGRMSGLISSIKEPERTRDSGLRTNL